jgi:GGDEF domain-containing protein
MDDRLLQSIRRHLQQTETQERIRGYIQRASAKLTVTIGEAAQLFDFTENQLRDWEERGLLRPLRAISGQRRYPRTELEKLAIIRDLIDAGYPLSAIPLDVEDLWQMLKRSVAADESVRLAPAGRLPPGGMPLDRRVAETDSALLWRYFASQALHHALLLLCDEVARGSVAILLPRGRERRPDGHYQPEQLAAIGESLVGWLSYGRAFHLLLEASPSFEYPTDFRIQPLQADDELYPEDPTLIIVPRQMRSLNLSRVAVRTIRRLLAPIYACASQWPIYFAPDLRNWLYPARSFPRGIDPEDSILNGLMELIITLGGRSAQERDRWHCCCLLLPEDPTQPPAQQALLVEAASSNSPHRPGQSRLPPNEGYLYFRALQSRSLLYRRRLASRDTLGSSLAAAQFGISGSALALPIMGENGAALGVLYVLSLEPDAFSEEDLRLLRVMGHMIEDLLMIYRARLTAMRGLESVLTTPELIDDSFGYFLSENDFVRDIESLLASLLQSDEQPLAALERPSLPGGSAAETSASREAVPAVLAPTQGPAQEEALSPAETLSIIALDIDNQSQIIRRYGELALRNLTQAIGQRIQRQLVDGRLYHIYGGRFYLLLNDISLARARQIAQTLRLSLRRSYRVELTQRSLWQSEPSDTGVELGEISVSLGVTLYPRTKLIDLLQRYASAPASPLAEVRALIMSDLDQALDLGREEGGNIVISWDPQAEDRGPHVRRFIRLDASEGA